MSKNKTLFAIAALACTFFSGCEIIEDDRIVDWAPVNIYIYATDSAGQSIIRPDMPGMTLTFKGETYSVKDTRDPNDSIHTRAYMPFMYGLFAEAVDTTANPKEYRLYFGEIDGAADMDEDITLNWPDGTIDVIHYHCSDHNESKLTVNRTWELNGKDHDGSTFHFNDKSLKPFPVATLTDQGYSDGKLYYAITSADNHEVQVKGYDQSLLSDVEGYLEIPSEILIDNTKYECTAIQDSALMNCYQLKNVTLPQSIKSIGNASFWGCRNIKTLLMPDGVTIIGNRAFFQCNKLAYVNIPNSVTDIDEGAFFECTSLSSVKIPERVKDIKDKTFYGCENLTTVILSDSLKSIGAYAFNSCDITSIDIPEGVTSIGEGAFQNNTKLSSISIPQSVTFIDICTFECCFDLTSVTIPSSITSIGERAFKGDVFIRSIICQSTTPPSITTDLSNVNGSFEVYIYHLATVFVPAGSLDAYKNDDNWKNFVKFEELQ
ncbi:MAG: leucine-rich repeat domain-containing protein [Bacteroidaceae bacterium]|nr:leucine-rich repeat domain-containing protein [Bacteroidaceae bacterium]